MPLSGFHVRVMLPCELRCSLLCSGRASVRLGKPAGPGLFAALVRFLSIDQTGVSYLFSLSELDRFMSGRQLVLFITGVT
jgi:hypothetical protein